MIKKNRITYFVASIAMFLCCMFACSPSQEQQSVQTPKKIETTIELTRAEANRLAELPFSCIQEPFPYKSGIIIDKEADLALPQVHHPAFYGCFDWHSAVHGHWSLIYLLKEFPELEKRDQIIQLIDQNLTAANIQTEVEYFSLNSNTSSFERTYGWAWLLKLQEELHTWDHPKAREWKSNLQPLVDYISNAYVEYLPKLVYPIRVGEHSNTAFGLSFAHDYAATVGDNTLKNSIEQHARRFYLDDANCPISWEPSGYDFLSPCLQELDIMSKVLSEEEFTAWSVAFLPDLAAQKLILEPGEIRDRSDGKLVHLDGLNFSRAWCLYSVQGNNNAHNIATQHLDFSLSKITDGDYAGQHWLASFALYAFKMKRASDY